jgi:uncharacterized protein
VLARRARDWILIVAVTVGGGWAADTAGLPGGYLFAALLVGLGYALHAPGRVRMPPAGFRAGQAVTGVALGTFLHTSTLTGLGTRWIAVILVSVATLVVTIGAGVVLARVSRLDRPTASLGMVAGGAAGIVAMAGDLGADDRPARRSRRGCGSPHRRSSGRWCSRPCCRSRACWATPRCRLCCARSASR